MTFGAAKKITKQQALAVAREFLQQTETIIKTLKTRDFREVMAALNKDHADLLRSFDKALQCLDAETREKMVRYQDALFLPHPTTNPSEAVARQNAINFMYPEGYGPVKGANSRRLDGVPELNGLRYGSPENDPTRLSNFGEPGPLSRR